MKQKQQKLSVIYGHKRENGEYLRFYYSMRLLGICEHSKDNLFKVTVVEAKDQKPRITVIDADYWGWWSNKDKKFVHVYPSRIQVETCFVYGYLESEKKGEGKLLRLDLVTQEPIKL